LTNFYNNKKIQKNLENKQVLVKAKGKYPWFSPEVALHLYHAKVQEFGYVDNEVSFRKVGNILCRF
jgi:hypothetical protein